MHDEIQRLKIGYYLIALIFIKGDGIVMIIILEGVGGNCKI